MFKEHWATGEEQRSSEVELWEEGSDIWARASLLTRTVLLHPEKENYPPHLKHVFKVFVCLFNPWCMSMYNLSLRRNRQNPYGTHEKSKKKHRVPSTAVIFLQQYFHVAVVLILTSSLWRPLVSVLWVYYFLYILLGWKVRFKKVQNAPSHILTAASATMFYSSRIRRMNEIILSTDQAWGNLLLIKY